MDLGNVLHLFITLVVLLQAPANGGMIRTGFRIICEEFMWPLQKRTTVIMYDGCNLCPWGDCRPFTKPPDKPELDLEADVTRLTGILAKLKKMDYSTVTKDYKDDLMDMMLKRSEIQRNAIVAAYKAKTNVDVEKEISAMPYDSDGGAPRYRILMQALSTPLPVFFAQKFADAMKNQKYESKRDLSRILMVEMLISLPSCLVNKIIEAYNSGFGDFFTDLKSALVTGKMTSDYIDVVESLAKNKWGNSNGMMAWIRALLDANKLKKSVASKPIDEVKNRYSELFTKKSFSHIVKTIKAYEYLKNEEGSFLKDIIYKKLGNVDEVYKIMTRILTDKPLYFATKMENIFLRRGKYYEDCENDFVGLFRGRLDIDLQDIIDRYNKQAEIGFIRKRFLESFKDFLDSFIFPRDFMFHVTMLRILT